MAKYIAFLRAINVGGHTVKMDRLRALFEDLALKNVETFIASGNVIFDSPRKAERLTIEIESHLASGLGYAVATMLRTDAQVRAIAAYQAFAEPKVSANALYVGFLNSAPDIAHVDALMTLQSDVHDFVVRDREVYWRIAGNFSDSKITNATIEKKLGMAATFRNITTVTKLAEKYAK